jgi:hypothetical protein
MTGFPALYRLQDKGEFIGWVHSEDCYLLKRCPGCGGELDYSHFASHPYHVAYPCGGRYVETIDLEGTPCWMGRCGKPLKQLELAFPEEAVCS